MDPLYLNAQKKVKELLKKHKITEPPIRIEDIIKGEGLKVYEAEFQKPHNNDISGFIDKDENSIYVNKMDDDSTQAYTLAHELGHWLLHKSELDKNENLGIMYRKMNIQHNKDQKEKEANYVAANILVPENLLKKYFKDFSLPQLAHIFGVPIEVILYRIQLDYEHSQ